METCFKNGDILFPRAISQSDVRQKDKTGSSTSQQSKLLDVTSREADASTHHRDFGNLSKLSYAKAGNHLEVILFEYSRRTPEVKLANKVTTRRKPVLRETVELATAQTRAAAVRNFAVDDPRGIS